MRDKWEVGLRFPSVPPPCQAHLGSISGEHVLSLASMLT